MEIKKIIETAKENIGGPMASSSEAALSDAITCYKSGFMDFARSRALTSLEYSVGRFSPIYKECST